MTQAGKNTKCNTTKRTKNKYVLLCQLTARKEVRLDSERWRPPAGTYTKMHVMSADITQWYSLVISTWRQVLSAQILRFFKVVLLTGGQQLIMSTFLPPVGAMEMTTCQPFVTAGISEIASCICGGQVCRRNFIDSYSSSSAQTIKQRVEFRSVPVDGQP